MRNRKKRIVLQQGEEITIKTHGGCKKEETFSFDEIEQMLDKKFSDRYSEENPYVMVAAQLDDGREHIHCKNHKAIKYDLSTEKDQNLLEQYEELFIEKKMMCYSKDLTSILPNVGSDDNKVTVTGIKIYPYDEELHIPYRTLGYFQFPNKGDM